MYDNAPYVHQIVTSASVQQVQQAALAALEINQVRVEMAAPARPNVDRWREGELQTASVVRAAQLDRFERSVDGVLRELRTVEERRVFEDVVQRVLLNLDQHFRGAAVDEHEEAEAVAAIAGAFTRQGRLDEGLRRYLEASNLYRSAGDRAAEAVMLTKTAELHIRLKSLTRGFELYEEALKLLRGTGDWRAEAQVLATLASIRVDLNEWRPAEESALAALRLLEAHELDDAELQALAASSFSTLAMAWFADERYPEAKEALRSALAAARMVGDHRAEAQVLMSLGIIAIRQDNFKEAATQLGAASELLDGPADLSLQEEINHILVQLRQARRWS